MRGRTVAAFLAGALLALGTWLSSWQARPAGAGLERTVRDGAGRLLDRRIVPSALLPGPGPLPPPGGELRFEGELLLPDTGLYRLQLVSSAAARLDVDGTRLETSGQGADFPVARVHLSSRPASLRLELHDVATSDTLRLFWLLPRTGSREPLPPRALRLPQRLLSRRGASGLAAATALLFGLAAAAALGVSRAGLAAAAVTLLLLYPVIRSDGVGYYGYVRSLALDGDLDFRNDFASQQQAVNGLPMLLGPQRRAGSDRPVNMWSILPSLLWLPALALGHVASLHLGLPADGFGFAYAAPVCLTTALGGWLTLGLCHGALRRRLPAGAAAAGALLAFAGTPLLFYTLLDPAFVHALAAPFATIFLLAWSRFHGRRALLATACFGIATGIYWQLALLAALPAVELARCALRRDREGVRREAGMLALMSVGLAAGMLPQLVAWKAMTGSFLTIPQGSGFLNGRLGLNLFLTFLAPYHGLLTWTPLMVLGAAAVARGAGQDPLARGGLTLVVVLALHNASIKDWCGGGGFALRRLTPAVLPVALGLALTYRRSGRWMRGAMAAAACWSFVLALATRTGTLAFPWSHRYAYVPSDYALLPPGALTMLVRPATLDYVAFAPRLAVGAASDGLLICLVAWLALGAAAALAGAALHVGGRLGQRLAAEIEMGTPQRGPAGRSALDSRHATPDACK